MPIPTLTTERLILRPFTLADAPIIASLANDRRIYDTTLNIPHPYALHDAERWINHHQTWFNERTNVVWAITERASGDLMGAINLRPLLPMQRAELGYWIGVPFWNQGYMSEAAKAVTTYGFNTMNLHRIYAQHFAGNPASGRVMQKIGLIYEGTLRGHIRKDDRFEDSIVYGITRDNWHVG